MLPYICTPLLFSSWDWCYCQIAPCSIIVLTTLFWCHDVSSKTIAFIPGKTSFICFSKKNWYIFCAWLGGYFGNTGCQLFKRGIRNWKDFCLKINIPKGNYWILRIGLMGSLSSLQKSEVLKLIILIFHV